MDKRYQVFISSTYQDLQEERQEIIQALLELDCIPSGMELFPAANEDQWSLIKRVIDDCDYYMVVIGGRYGSIGPSGLSYTEMEYRYALECGKPIIGFIHKSPDKIVAGKSEKSDEGKLKLEEFRKLVSRKMVKYWETPMELGSKVSRSLISLIKNNPAIGWVRADKVTNENSASEILSLKNKIESLEEQLELSRTKAPEGTDELAQGEDEFNIDVIIEDYTEIRNYMSINMTWNQIFYILAPMMINESSKDDLKKALRHYVAKEVQEYMIQNDLDTNPTTVHDIDNTSYDTVIVQLRALGLIKKSNKSRSIKDTNTYWTLTPYGDEVMTKLRAVRKTFSQ
ncbi:MAG: DUF4062 domain-containing protein [Maledivibacter sp.]|jgi:hypothetical protein|nr:DUF4062 domain-containing protein [Maledivibacter sp.]